MSSSVFVVYVAFCSLAMSRRNDVECPIDVARCLLPVAFCLLYLAIVITVAFAFAFRHSHLPFVCGKTAEKANKKTTKPATHAGKCRNAEMPQCVRQRERIAADATAAAAEWSQRSRDCRAPLADCQIPNEAKNVHTCSMQTDRRQWVRG